MNVRIGQKVNFVNHVNQAVMVMQLLDRVVGDAIAMITEMRLAAFVTSPRENVFVRTILKV